jgi:hypothetical protein
MEKTKKDKKFAVVMDEEVDREQYVTLEDLD